MEVSAGKKIEIIGKVRSYPNRDGIQLDFYKFDPKSEVEVTDDWWGIHSMIQAEIYLAFKNKPVKITIESV